MPLEADFTYHAARRAEQRVSLSPDELRLMIDDGHTVNIGQEPGFNRRHLLLYSIPDEAHFVVVQDSLRGQVVTVLPLAYHENLAWRATPAQLTAAEQKARALAALNAPPLRTLYTTAHYTDEAGRPKSRRLFGWTVSEEDVANLKLFRDRAYLAELCQALEKHNLLERMVSLSVRRGKTGAPWLIEHDVLTDALAKVCLEAA